MDRNRRLFLIGLAAGGLDLIVPKESFAYTPLPYQLVSSQDIDEAYAYKARRLATYIATLDRHHLILHSPSDSGENRKKTSVSLLFEEYVFSLSVINVNELSARTRLIAEEDQLNIAFYFRGKALSLEDKGLRGVCSSALLPVTLTKSDHEEKFSLNREGMQYHKLAQGAYQTTLDFLLRIYDHSLV